MCHTEPVEVFINPMITQAFQIEYGFLKIEQGLANFL